LTQAQRGKCPGSPPSLRTRNSLAEDAAEAVFVEYHALDAVTDMRTALDPQIPVIHPSLGNNLAFERILNAGKVDQALADSDEVVEAEFIFGRHTGVTLEPRAVVADWNTAEARLTIYPSWTRRTAGSRGLQGCRRFLRDQGPYLCRRDGDLCAVKVAAPAHQVRRRPGRKLQYGYPRVRPSLQGRIGVKRDGTIRAFEIDDLTGIGPYSMYPRTSAIEANQVVNLVGGPYVARNYRARARVVFRNKNVMCQYRAVGHPIACSVTEGLVDLAAARIGMDPVEIRRRNLVPDDAYPCASPSGLRFEQLSHRASLSKLLGMMDYEGLRA
jgi:CO/xanthine dehydrogenase Mo-binding subunit